LKSSIVRAASKQSTGNHRPIDCVEGSWRIVGKWEVDPFFTHCPVGRSTAQNSFLDMFQIVPEREDEGL
jgi:hypothetical protein